MQVHFEQRIPSDLENIQYSNSLWNQRNMSQHADSYTTNRIFMSKNKQIPTDETNNLIQMHIFQKDV